jgi:hypothetical protein
MLGGHCALVEIRQVLQGEERVSECRAKAARVAHNQGTVPPAVHGCMGMIMLIYLL